MKTKTKKANCPRCDYSKAYFARDFADGKGKPKTDLVCADCGYSFTIADHKRESIAELSGGRYAESRY